MLFFVTSLLLLTLRVNRVVYRSKLDSIKCALTDLLNCIVKVDCTVELLQLQTTKMQQQQAEEERLQAEHSKGRQAVERSNSKSMRRRQSNEPPTSAVQEQLVVLSSKHEHNVNSCTVHPP